MTTEKEVRVQVVVVIDMPADSEPGKTLVRWIASSGPDDELNTRKTKELLAHHMIDLEWVEASAGVYVSSDDDDDSDIPF